LLLYYITDRQQFSGSGQERRLQLLNRIEQAAQSGVDFIQLREKDLSARELEQLAHEALDRICTVGGNTRFLLNSRTDVALAIGADGVHLRSSDVSPRDVRKMWKAAGGTDPAVVAVSCHTDAEVIAAENAGADFVVFGPVFEKKDGTGEPVGLERLGSACRHKIPVFALGGVNLRNAKQCIEAGARGIAGIRLFQEGDLSATVRALRAYA
jgi:thiamine-phosphate pyrophosphorylase